MPSINDIKKQPDKKFKKREYRPWDMDGDNQEQSEDNISKSTKKQSSEKPLNIISSGEILKVSPERIEKWEYKDRPESELGDIQSLANEFLSIGQQQPCIVRPSNNKEYDYTLIIGERRWHAAKLAKIELLVIVKNLNDSEAALSQAVENESRQNLSDYAKGMSYSNLISSGVITQKDLTEKLGISKQKLSRLLSFNKIPNEVINSIQDMTRISSGTAEKIKQLCNKGQEYIDIIITLSDKLSEGKIGHEKLVTAVEKILNKKQININTESNKIYSNDGRHLFTWRLDNNSRPSIHFPKDVLSLIESKNIGISNFSNQVVRIIENEIKKLK
jgi:ParB family chromosome partitioning protein